MRLLPARRWGAHLLIGFSHRLLRRGRPLDSLAPVINLIANTTTDTGLSSETSIDDTIYEKGIEVPDDEFAALHITREKFHGEWN